MLQGEHSAILSTFIKPPFVSKIFVLSFFEWPLKTGFTVNPNKFPRLGKKIIFKIGKMQAFFRLGSSRYSAVKIKSLLSTMLQAVQGLLVKIIFRTLPLQQLCQAGKL